jgi:heme-degrading monooxygenase HmoA
MEKPYTHTTWRVRAGSEDEFVRRWSEWVDWSHREGLEAPALLLRDLENPQAFISFGPWANMAAVRNWRALAGYQERVARLSEILDSFEPRTLEIVARAITAMQALDGYRGVDARETEIGMSMKGLAEIVSKEEQGDQVSIFDLVKELLADDTPATKKKASAKKSKSKQPIPAPPNPHDYFPATAGASAPAVA